MYWVFSLEQAPFQGTVGIRDSGCVDFRVGSVVYGPKVQSFSTFCLQVIASLNRFHWVSWILSPKVVWLWSPKSKVYPCGRPLMLAVCLGEHRSLFHMWALLKRCSVEKKTQRWCILPVDRCRPGQRGWHNVYIIPFTVEAVAWKLASLYTASQNQIRSQVFQMFSQRVITRHDSSSFKITWIRNWWCGYCLAKLPELSEFNPQSLQNHPL